MALSLSMTDSSIREPLVQNRFIFSFTSIPGAAGQEDSLAFACKSATIPTMTFNSLEHYRLNERFRMAGRPTFNDISLTFMDFIGTSENQSAGEILNSWSTSIYNPVTGQQTYKQQYSTSATLAQLDPLGNVIRLWNIFYAWPMEINFGGDLSSESDAPTEVSLSLAYDYAIKGVDLNEQV